MLCVVSPSHGMGGRTWLVPITPSVLSSLTITGSPTQSALCAEETAPLDSTRWNVSLDLTGRISIRLIVTANWRSGMVTFLLCGHCGDGGDGSVAETAVAGRARGSSRTPCRSTPGRSSVPATTARDNRYE